MKDFVSKDEILRNRKVQSKLKDTVNDASTKDDDNCKRGKDVEKILFDLNSQKHSYFLTRIVLLKYLCFIYGMENLLFTYMYF